MSERITIRISDSQAGQRLDRVLAQHLQTPRNQIQQWIRSGWVTLDGRATKPSQPVAAGETVICEPEVRELGRGIDPETGELTILYEDSEIVVLDKPAGLVVHPGAGRTQGTLVHRLLARFPEMGEVGGAGRPGIVHRLDKDTTGVLVVARTPRSYEHLSRAFAERRVQKRYLALVYGEPPEERGRIEAPIGRHPEKRKEMTVRPTGRPALTLYERLACAGGVCLLGLDLATGRTHQIRVHLKSLGNPLIGDPVYGEARWKGLPRAAREPLRRFPRPALHAWLLRLEHPTRGDFMVFESPVPDDLCQLWREVTGQEIPPFRATR